MRLLCGTNILAVFARHDLPRAARMCLYCTGNVVEDLVHFCMYCPRYCDLRAEMLMFIRSNLSDEGVQIWSRLSYEMKCYILLGLYFPLISEDLKCIRYYSAVYLTKMYNRRRAFEPP